MVFRRHGGAGNSVSDQASVLSAATLAIKTFRDDFGGGGGIATRETTMNDDSGQPENPYEPSQHPSPPRKSRLPIFASGCAAGIGLVCAILLLLVVVGFGLFIGFCGK
jgi:hypothetical protein